MTTAHRPTFDPARGKDALTGPAYHQRLLPAHTLLKHRQAGQGGAADAAPRDLRAELLRAEAAVNARKNGTTPAIADGESERSTPLGAIEDARVNRGDGEDVEEDAEMKRRRLILEDAHDIDADSDGSGGDGDGDDDDESSDDEEDEEAELMRELAKIKAERAAAKQKEEDELARKAEEQREVDIARGNPLLDPMRGRDEGTGTFGVKRRWDDDVVFRNQGRGTEEKGKRREFVNDLLRSDFHKKFMVSSSRGCA